jgi:endonuclease/exonuclease/phosphatase (EEP) superfamily protein YafD
MSLKKSLGVLFWAFALFTGMLALMNFWGGICWCFDLVSPFKVQLFVFQTILLLLGLIFRRFDWVGDFKSFWGKVLWGLLGAVWLWHGLGLLPFYGFQSDQSSANTLPIRFLQMNLLFKNQSFSSPLYVFQQYQPDVVTLEEASPPWQQFFQRSPKIKKWFPYQYYDDSVQMAILSKYPLEGFRAEHIPNTPRPRGYFSLILRVPHGLPINVIQIHPVVPTSESGFQLQERYLNHLIQKETAVFSDTSPLNPKPLRVVIGDFNMTPWSSHFKLLPQALGLKDSMEGVGVQGSYPEHFKPLMIPIDHCLVSPDIVVKERQILPSVGSDHYPLLLDLGLPQQKP